MIKSFADGSKCPAFGEDTNSICATNTKSDLKYANLYIAATSADMVNIQKLFETSKTKYVATALVLCGCFNSEKAELCSTNFKTLVQKLEPQTITIIGKEVREYCEKNSIPFNFYCETVKEIEVGTNKVPKQKTGELMSDNNAVEFKNESEKASYYTFKIPEKYYTKDYRLVDVQSIMSQGRVIYIFRDKDNKKEFYEVPLKSDDFYWYESPGTDNNIIEKFENLQLKVGNYKKRNLNQNGYGGDTNLTTLHSVDYYLNNKEEAPLLKKNILHFDIEVYTYKQKIFPSADVAQFPINAISFRMDDADHTTMYLLKLDGEIDPRIDEIVKSKKYPHLTIFNSEYAMLSSFFSMINSVKPDFIAGWNSNGFDIPYIVGRMKKLSISPKEFSPFGNVYADSLRNIVTGYICLDQLQLYKDLTYTQLPTYRLDYVANLELGQGKVQYEGSLMNLYNNDIDKFINYSFRDTDLVHDIEVETGHIGIFDELRRVTTASQSGASSSVGQAEGLFLYSMKKKGLIARNTAHSTKEKLPGAYVFEARGGLFEGLLCDFDFRSLYPSIINTWNIGPDTYIGKIDAEVAFQYIYDKESLVGKQITLINDPMRRSEKKVLTLEEFDKYMDDNQATITVAGTIFIGHDKYTSIYHNIVSMLFDGRAVYKKKMLNAKASGDDAGYTQYYGKQMAYKILANSLYGVLGNEHFKFYNNDLAKSITLTGQDLLKYCTVHCDNFMKKRDLGAKFEFDPRFVVKVEKLDDVIYGDTDSMFVYLTDFLNDLKIPVKKCQEVQSAIDRIQDYINKDALGYFSELHHLNQKYSMIYLKNEFLFSKYYTLSGKKHYASHIISQEGKSIDELDIKGLEIKRSEIPLASRELLSSILNIIMSDDIEKSDILPKIDKLVDQKRKEILKLIDQRDSSVVRTVNYGAPLSTYKKVPYHIHAMLMWNLIVNEDFRYGTRGKLWDVRGIDLAKAPDYVKKNYYEKFLKKYKASDMNYICLPEEVEKLPEYFIVDINKIVKYCCDDRVELLVEPLRKKVDQLLLW